MASHPPITKFQNAALVARVRQVLKETGLTPRRWSMEATGKPDTVRNILRGGSQAPRIDTMRKLASIVENCPVEWLIGETDLRNLEAAAHAQSLPAGEMPLLGYIGAGEQVYHFGVGATGLSAPMPPGVTRGVAAEVRGQSMQPVYRDRDLVIATEHPGNVAELVGQDCFVQVNEGPLFLKVLRRGTKGRFNLESYNEAVPVIVNQAVEWAAPVSWIKRGK